MDTILVGIRVSHSRFRTSLCWKKKKKSLFIWNSNITGWLIFSFPAKSDYLRVEASSKTRLFSPVPNVLIKAIPDQNTLGTQWLKGTGRHGWCEAEGKVHLTVLGIGWEGGKESRGLWWWSMHLQFLPPLAEGRESPLPFPPPLLAF